jgi:putative MATE family efflux protein
MLGMAVQVIYNLTDTYFIGLMRDTNMIAAVSLATPLFMAIQAFGNIFAVGSASYVSRKLGEKDYGEARHATSVAFYTSVIVGVVLAALMLIFKTPLLQAIGTSEDTFAPTDAYFTIIAACSVLPVLQVSLAGLVRSEGATGKSTMGLTIGVVSNIILDPIFIFPLGLGIAGAAWATIIGNALGVGYYILHFCSKKTLLSIRPRDFKPTARIFGQSLKIGLSSAVSTAIMGFSMVLANVFAHQYGDATVAGNGVQMRVNSMCIMLMIGMAQGYQPFAGYNYGARNFHRLISGLKTTMLYNSALACFFTLMFVLFGSSFIRAFTDDPDVIAAGTKILHAFCWGAPFIGMQMTLMTTFQATGKAVRAMLISLGRQCILYFPLLFILNAKFGFAGYIYAQPAADVLTTIAALLMSISFIRELRAKHDEMSRPLEVQTL